MKIKSSNYYSLSLLVLVLGLFFRLYLLGNQSFWNDEGTTLINSLGATFQENISTILSLEHGDRFQPLYFNLLFFWRQLFGINEISIRLFSVFLGISTAVVVFLIALKIYDKKQAFWSCLLISTSSFAIYYSQNARPPILLMFLASLQLYFSISLFNDIGFKKIEKWLFVASTALATFSSVISIPFTIALSISHLLFGKKVRQWFTWWFLAALLSLPAVLIHLSSPNATEPSTIEVTRENSSLIQNIFFIFYGLLVGETYGPPIVELKSEDKIQVLINYLPQLALLFLVVAIIVFTLILVLSTVQSDSIYKQSDRFFVALFIFSLVFLIFFTKVTEINLLPRHCSYLYLPIALIFPSCFRCKTPFIQDNQKRLIDKLYSKKIFNLPNLSMSILLILNLYSLGNHYFNKAYSRDDYRSAANWLSENITPNTTSILLVGKDNLLRYYNDNKTLYYDGLVEQLNSGKFAKKVKGIAGDSEQVFLIVGRRLDLAPQEVLEKEMSEFYRLSSQVSFPYIKIYCFSKK